jgi:hypothetical protein
MKVSDMPFHMNVVVSLLVVLLFALGCGTEGDDVWGTDVEITQTETVQHNITPMWDSRPTSKKHVGKRHQFYHNDRPRNLNNRRGPEAQREGIHWVRETGFQPSVDEDEGETDFVRETGFMPAPRLTLVSISDGVAHLSWTSIADVGYYILNGRVIDIEQGRIEQHGTSFILRGNEMSIDLDDRVWQFQVTAVGNNKSFRSKASNRVQADPNGE